MSLDIPSPIRGDFHRAKAVALSRNPLRSFPLGPFPFRPGKAHTVPQCASRVQKEGMFFAAQAEQALILELWQGFLLFHISFFLKTPPEQLGLVRERHIYCIYFIFLSPMLGQIGGAKLLHPTFLVEPQ